MKTEGQAGVGEPVEVTQLVKSFRAIRLTCPPNTQCFPHRQIGTATLSPSLLHELPGLPSGWTLACLLSTNGYRGRLFLEQEWPRHQPACSL